MYDLNEMKYAKRHKIILKFFQYQHQIDALDYWFDAIVSKEYEDDEKVIAYLGKSLTKSESKIYYNGNVVSSSIIYLPVGRICY